MKKSLYYISIFALLSIYSCKKDNNATTTPTTTTTKPDYTAYYTELNAAMDKMKNSMDTVTMTMDNDADFAKMMIPHHQGAIDMSNVNLKYTHDAKGKELANKTITGNQESITRLKDFLSKHMIMMSGNNMEFMNKMDSVMMKMNVTMKSFHKSNDPDYDFATTMIPHHQGALDMSKLELTYGKAAIAKAEAKKDIEDQEKAVIELGDFKTTHGDPAH